MWFNGKALYEIDTDELHRLAKLFFERADYDTSNAIYEELERRG